MTHTYRDGLGGERCPVCYQLLKTADDIPSVSIRLKDLEEVTCLLVDDVKCPEVLADTIARFERAAGRTVQQMKDRERAQRQHHQEGL